MHQRESLLSHSSQSNFSDVPMELGFLNASTIDGVFVYAIFIFHPKLTQKYFPGGHFGAHYDGCYVRSEDERSLFTFMIYLNTAYTGGQTRFLDDSLLNANPTSNNNNDDRTVKIEEKDKKVTAIVGPLEPGVAVVSLC